MKNEKQPISFPSANVLDLLFVLFLGLKLSNIITWSWAWVFAPYWVPIVIIGLIMGGLTIYTLVQGKKK